MDKKIVTLYLEPSEYEFLRDYSFRAKKSMSSTLRDCISWLQAASQEREEVSLSDVEAVAEDKAKYVIRNRKSTPPIVVDSTGKVRSGDVCEQPPREGDKPAGGPVVSRKPQMMADLGERVEPDSTAYVLRLLEDATASFLRSDYFKPSLVTDGTLRGKSYGKAISDLKFERPLSMEIADERRGGK